MASRRATTKKQGKETQGMGRKRREENEEEEDKKKGEEDEMELY